LAQNSGKWFWSKSVEKVLDKMVECALAVHTKYVVEEENANKNKQHKDGHAKEHKWKELDTKFVTAILSITTKKENMNAKDD
jgi:hypothetical protein